MILHKHMNQWITPTLLRAAFLCEVEVSGLIEKWSLGMPIGEHVIRYSFLDMNIDPQSFIAFVSTSTTPNDMSSLRFFIKYRLAILKIATGEDLSHSVDSDVMHLRNALLKHGCLCLVTHRESSPASRIQFCVSLQGEKKNQCHH